MNQLFQFLAKNKEWIFSGVGIAIISAIFWTMSWLFKKRKKSHKYSKAYDQRNSINIDDSTISGNVAGRNLTSIEAGRDIYLLNQDKQYTDISGNIHFVIKMGQTALKNWIKVDKLPKPFSISEFKQTCSQYFKISGFLMDIEPSFDITIVNETGSTLVLNRIGIEIKSVAHIWLCYGEPQATKIIQQASYKLQVPDIRAEISKQLGNFPRMLEPMDLNKKILIDLPDPWRVESESTFRCELLLKDFIAHMPNYSIICFLIETHKQLYYSELIGMHTL